MYGSIGLIVLLLALGAIGGYNLRSYFRLRTVELVAVGASVLTILLIAYGWSHVPTYLVSVLSILPLLVSASIISGRKLCDGGEPERMNEFEMTAMTDVSAVMMFLVSPLVAYCVVQSHYDYYFHSGPLFVGAATYCFVHGCRLCAWLSQD